MVSMPARGSRGMLAGQGSLTLADGTTYVGGFANHRYHGDGTLHQADGSSYSGQVSSGVATSPDTDTSNPQLTGSALPCDCICLLCQWDDGMRTGIGRLRMSDGCVYDGEWQGGVRHGQGVFTAANGVFTYSGPWLEDRALGNAVRLPARCILGGSLRCDAFVQMTVVELHRLDRVRCGIKREG